MIVLVALPVFLLLVLSSYIVVMPILGSLRLRAAKPQCSSQRSSLPRILVLIPAHNEGEHLRPTLRSIQHLDYPSHLFDIVVIADNCTDNTANVAIGEGCEVWERSNDSARGKGYALGWALSHPQIASYDACVILDADTHPSSNLLEVFAREMQLESVPVQARVNFEFPSTGPYWLSLMSTATQRAEEHYVCATRSHLKLYQGLQGTGFCVPVGILQIVPWSTYSVCEDLEYGFQLAAHGVPIRFVQDASVTTVMTGRLRNAGAQRERWARGTYGLIARLIPLQFLRAFTKRDWKSLESCFYLMTRSRLSLIFLTAISSVALLIGRHTVTHGIWISFGIALTLECAYALALLATLRAQYTWTQLIFGFSRYSIWIIRQHLGALLSVRSKHWVRTERG